MYWFRVYIKPLKESGNPSKRDSICVYVCVCLHCSEWGQGNLKEVCVFTFDILFTFSLGFFKYWPLENCFSGAYVSEDFCQLPRFLPFAHRFSSARLNFLSYFLLCLMGMEIREQNVGESENLVSSEAKFHVLKLLLTAILLIQWVAIC